jgi:hypothetical protein
MGQGQQHEASTERIMDRGVEVADSRLFEALVQNHTRATNSSHWKSIKFQVLIPSWAKRAELQNPIEFN